MTPKRVYILLCGLIVLFIAATIGGAYELNGVLEKRSNSLVNTKAKLSALNQEQVELAQAKKDITTYHDLYNISRVVVPESKDQAETVRQLTKLAAENGVSIGQITFPASSLGSGPTGAAAASSASASVAPGANAKASTNSSANALSQLQKVTNISGVYVMTLTVDGTTDSQGSAGYPQLIHFLHALEQNRLTALVNTINISPGGGTGSSGGASSTSNAFSFILTLNIYIKP